MLQLDSSAGAYQVPVKPDQGQRSTVSDAGRGGAGTATVPLGRRAKRLAKRTEISRVDYELAEPRADSLIESFRGFGYTLRAAIADLIDNSISASATNV